MPAPTLSPWRRAVTAMLGDLRTHRRVAALVTLTAAVSLAAALPVAGLFGGRLGGLRERIALLPVAGSDLDLAWNGIAGTPTTTQQGALHLLTLLLASAAIATLAVGAVTMLVLLASQESVRAGERQVQRSVGASHRLLRVSTLLEALLLSGAAVVLGGIAGSIAFQATISAWPGIVGAGTLTAAAAAGVIVIAIIVAGSLFPVLLPARRIAEIESPGGFSLVPAVFQIAICLIALTTSALIGVRAAALGSTGIAPSTAGAVLPVHLAHLTTEERAARYAALLAQFDTRSDSAGVSLTAPGNLVGLGLLGMVTTNCGACTEGGMNLQWHTKPATYQFVSADTFRLLGMPMVAGRGLSSKDTWASPRVAVVSRSLAAREFEGGDAIGRQIKTPDTDDDWSTVIGVIDDPVPFGVGGALQPRYTVYLSVLQFPPSSAELLLPSAPAGRVMERIRETLEVPTAARWRSLGALRSAEVAPVAWFGRLFGIEGWAMVLLSTLGAFALMRRWVGSLLRELGIRRAVGARRRHVMLFILLRAVGVGVAGIGGGLWLGSTVWELLPSFLTGVTTWDTGIVTRFAALLVGSVLAGAAVPAWRAAKTAPAVLVESIPT